MSKHERTEPAPAIEWLVDDGRQFELEGDEMDAGDDGIPGEHAEDHDKRP